MILCMEKPCGACCYDLYVEVVPEDNIPAEMMAMQSWNGERYFLGMKQRENGSCIALDEETRMCTIHTNRPKTCRDFEAGCNLCLRLRRAGAPA